MSEPAPGASRATSAAIAFLRRLRPLLAWRFATLWLIVGVNVLLMALYLWSRGGATTHVRIEAAGSSYHAFVDG